MRRSRRPRRLSVVLPVAVCGDPTRMGTVHCHTCRSVWRGDGLRHARWCADTGTLA